MQHCEELEHKLISLCNRHRGYLHLNKKRMLQLYENNKNEINDILYNFFNTPFILSEFFQYINKYKRLAIHNWFYTLNMASDCIYDESIYLCTFLVNIVNDDIRKYVMIGCDNYFYDVITKIIISYAIHYKS